MNPDVGKVYEEGRAAFAAGDFAVAEKCFTQVLRHHSDWPELYGKLGTIYHHKGRFTDAVKLYAHALQLNPKYVEARLNLAVLLNDMGRYEHAGRLLEKMSKIVPYPGRLSMGSLATNHMSTGDAYFNLQLFNHARVEFEHATKLRPGWPDLRTKLGITYRRLGRFQDAVRELETAVALNPESAHSRTELALCRFQSGDRQRGVSEWEGVLNRWPDHEPARRYLEMARTSDAAVSAA
jgi:tetratricopeptide (TPR) repeat protein